MTATITISQLDREEIRILLSALRDKREQMLATQERERLAAIAQGRDIDLTVGAQAHRLASIMETLRQAHKDFPAVQCSVKFEP